MPSIINAATSGGLISTADTSGVLQLQTASTTALTITAGQLVGIGQTTPLFPLHITGASGVNTYATFSNATTGSTATNGFSIGVANGDSNAYIIQREAASLIFYTSATERMRINAGAPVLCLAGGNISATGTGIAFPATQSASSDANTLDDYEEGTFTPTVTAASGSNGGGSFQGSYTKIGRFVYVTMIFSNVSKGTLSGQIAVGGLPFSVTTINTTGTCRYSLGGTPPAGTTIICPQSGGGTGMELQCFSASGYLGNLAASNLGSSFDFFNITYIYQTST